MTALIELTHDELKALVSAGVDAALRKHAQRVSVEHEEARGVHVLEHVAEALQPPLASSDEDAMAVSRCDTCSELKSLDAFYRQGDDYKSRCIECEHKLRRFNALKKWQRFQADIAPVGKNILVDLKQNGFDELYEFALELLMLSPSRGAKSCLLDSISRTRKAHSGELALALAALKEEFAK